MPETTRLVGKLISMTLLCTFAWANSAAAEPSVRSIKLGMSLTEAEKVLSSKGYAVETSPATFDTAPGASVPYRLLGTDDQDTLIIHTDLNPAEPRVASILRRRQSHSSYKSPAFSVFQGALEKRNESKPQFAFETTPSESRPVMTHVLGYEWNKSGKAQKSKKQGQGKDKLPLCLQATRDSIAKLDTTDSGIHEPSSDYKVDGNGQFATETVGTYSPGCNRNMFVSATVNAEGQTINSFYLILMDHEMIKRGLDKLQPWLKAKGAGSK